MKFPFVWGGYFLVVFGAAATVWFFRENNMIFAVANTSLALVGIITAEVGKEFRKIERRLAQLEFSAHVRAGKP